MVVIRLAKSGAKKAPYFFITVADSRKPRDGRFIERLGFFNPSARGSEERLRFNLERYEYWISKGAQPSEKVLNLKMQAELSPEDLEKLFEKRDSRRLSRKEAKAVKLAEELKANAESEVKGSTSEEGSDTPENESTLAKEAVSAEEAPAEEAPAEEAPAEEAPAEEAPAEEASSETETSNDEQSDESTSDDADSDDEKK